MRVGPARQKMEILGLKVSKLVTLTRRVDFCEDSESGLGSKIKATQHEHWADALFDAESQSSCTLN